MLDDLQPRFDRAKFKDVVHFICSNSKPEELGNVKLHKILYFADMLTYLSTGEPLTGVEYQKQQFGPVARYLSSALNQLSIEGRIRIEKRDYFGYQKSDYISIQTPPREKFSNQEVRLLLDVIDYVSAKSAKEISELSHDAAWHAARIGETIPYYAALGLLPARVSEADISAAIEEAKRVRPFVDAEHRPN
jgi:uncharacterized phage-associated protein